MERNFDSITLGDRGGSAQSAMVNPFVNRFKTRPFPIKRRQMCRDESHGEAYGRFKNIALKKGSLIEPSMNGERVNYVECVRDRCDVAQ